MQLVNTMPSVYPTQYLVHQWYDSRSGPAVVQKWSSNGAKVTFYNTSFNGSRTSVYLEFLITSQYQPVVLITLFLISASSGCAALPGTAVPSYRCWYTTTRKIPHRMGRISVRHVVLSKQERKHTQNDPQSKARAAAVHAYSSGTQYTIMWLKIGSSRKPA